MLHRSMLLGKRLPLDPPLEHEGRIHKKKAIDHEGLPMALYLPLSAGAYFDKLQDQWLLKLLLLQRFSCDLFSFLSSLLLHAPKGTVSKRSFCSWERGPKAHPYAFGFRVKNRVGETCQALG